MQWLKDYIQGQKTRQNRCKQNKHDHLRRNRTSLLYQHFKEGETGNVRRRTNSGIKTYGSMLNGINPSKMETFFANTEQLKGISVNLSR